MSFLHDYRIVLGNWEQLGADAVTVRRAVFIEEQKVPAELEWDALDAGYLHAVAYDEEGTTLATGRLLPDGHIGRMAVGLKARGRGIGGAILKALMARARQRGDRFVILSAQLHAEEFYRRHGFEREGEPYLEAGIEHVTMRHIFDVAG
jgi:predicted GNAT family N-acyltransferase